MEMNNEREINLQGSGLTKKVVKGSFWVMVGQVLPLLATFVSTPFVIKYLGSEAYGVLILVGVVAGYFSFADFGMVLASTRFGSEAYATSSSEKEARVIRTAAVIGVSTSLFIAIPLFILSKWVVSDLLRVPVNLQSQASVALKLTSVALVMGFIGNIFNSPQLARLRMDLNILINAGFKILMILITPVVLYFGGGIVEASLVAFGAAFFMMLGNIIVSGTLLPRLFGLSVDKELFRPMLRFGWNVVLYGIGLAVCNNLDKLFLSRYVSVRSLAHYSVAFTFSNMATMFSMAMVQTLIPAFSQVLSPSKRPELINLFLKTVRISLIGIIPSIMVLMVIGKPFFTIWAGKEFGLNSIYPLYILLIGVLFSLIVYIPNCVLIASGKSDVFAKLYLVEIIPYAIILFILVNWLGIIGAAVAYSVKEIFNSIFFIRTTKKYTGLYFPFRSHFSSLFLGLLVFVPSIFVASITNGMSIWLLLTVPISLAMYCVVAWKALVTTTEKVFIRNYAKNIKSRLCGRFS